MSPFQRRNLEFRVAAPMGRARGAAPRAEPPMARDQGAAPWLSLGLRRRARYLRQGGRATQCGPSLDPKFHWKGGARGVKRKRSS